MVDLSSATFVSEKKTIAAIATASGSGALGVIRISGPATIEIAEALCRKPLPPFRVASYRSFIDENNAVIDRGILIYFPAPRSLTGEDVVELQGHGGEIVLQRMLLRVVELGACLAKPGEFLERAFLNGKITLNEAEAVADLIAAESLHAARAAAKSLEGSFSNQIKQIRSLLTSIRAVTEASLDFPEDVEVAIDQNKLLASKKQLEDLLVCSKQSTSFNRQFLVVICGKPNAGKSTLFNALLENEEAIVSQYSGTTRDLLRRSLLFKSGLKADIVDTAGIRVTNDEIEREGIRRAKQMAIKADVLLYVMDINYVLTKEDKNFLQQVKEDSTYDTRILLIYNKIDLKDMIPKRAVEQGFPVLYLSAKTKVGLDRMKDFLADNFQKPSHEGVFLARARHLESLEEAMAGLKRAEALSENKEPLEFFAEELRKTDQALGHILGERTSEDLLDIIFSQFCIGK